MKLTRKRFLKLCASGLAAAGGAAAYMRFIEPDWLEVTTKTVHLPNLQHSLKLLHLSDFHASPDVPYELIERSIDLGLAESPDMACLTGDFITRHLEQAEVYHRILKKLSDRVPTFACVGNHDGGSWAGRSNGYSDFSLMQALLENSGVRVLFNQSQQTTINGQPIRLIGLGDLWAKDLHPELCMETDRSSEAAIIVLAHNPDCKDDLQGYQWDLMLCGHTHGGQLIVPILGQRPFAPVRDLRFVEGLHPWKSKQIHVTRGVGNLHGMRFNCRPEVSLLNLV